MHRSDSDVSGKLMALASMRRYEQDMRAGMMQDGRKRLLRPDVFKKMAKKGQLRSGNMLHHGNWGKDTYGKKKGVLGFLHR